jgi:dihydropteroate synthase
MSRGAAGRHGGSGTAAAPFARAVPLPRGRALELRELPLVMGIVNVTPDSFSDGGEHLDPAVAVEAALRMERDGAAIVDIGGESTRPGAGPVGEQLELDRVIPVVENVRRRSSVTISIDTSKAAVAEAALHAGADVVNDVTALRGDPRMSDVVRRSSAAVILMHMRGTPRTMQQNPSYDDVVREVASELAAWRDAALAAGIAPDAIMVDPGIGFAKSAAHNLEILASLERFTALGPLVVGASRKSFVGQLTGRPAGAERVSGSLAAVAAAAAGGAAIVRVHDVAETADFLAVYGAIGSAR